MIFTDPFNLDHNLGAGVTRKMASYILTTFIRGRERFGFPRYDILAEHSQRFFFDVYYLTDGYEAPTDRNCRVCGKIGHIARDCPHSKANRRAEQKKEEEERRLGKEPGGMTQKPFSARPRSASSPNKQGQDGNADRGTPLSTAQPKKIPPRQEANVSSVNQLSRSQPDSQVVTSTVKKSQGSEIEEGAENNREGVQPEIPQREVLVQNIQTVVTSENVDSGSHEKILDTENAPLQSTQATSSSVAKNDTGVMNTISSCDVVTEPSGVKPPVHLPSSVNSDIRTAAGTAGTATVQSSNAEGVKQQPEKPPPGLPPGFYTPNGPPRVSRKSSEGPPPLIAGSIPQSLPVNMSAAGMPQGHPIVLGTPPLHPPGMVSPQSGQLMGSPIQHDLWLGPQGGVMLSSHSPPVRPLVPYPLSPELHELQLQHQWRGASESLPVGHQVSPLRGLQRLAEHNQRMLPQSPPEISRTVTWPLPPNSPHHNMGSYPDQTLLREQQFPLPGRHPPFPSNGSPNVAPQQTQFSHGASPGTAVGSPQQMPQLPHQGAPVILRAQHSPLPGYHHPIPGNGSPNVAPQQTQFSHGTPSRPAVGSPQQMPQLLPQGALSPPPAFGTHMVSAPYWPYWFYY